MAGLDPSILAGLKTHQLKTELDVLRSAMKAKRTMTRVGQVVNSRSSVNPRSPTNPRTLRPSLEAMTVQPQGLNQALSAGGADSRVHARLDKYTEDQLEQVGELGRLKLASSTCSGE